MESRRMNPSRHQPQAATGRPRRALWVLLFSLAGLPALFSAMVLPFAPAAALPWVLVSWPVAVASGYGVWRADHPNESGRYAVAWRMGRMLKATGGAAILLTLAVLPWQLTVGALVAYAAIISGIMVIGNRNP